MYQAAVYQPVAMAFEPGCSDGRGSGMDKRLQGAVLGGALADRLFGPADGTVGTAIGIVAFRPDGLRWQLQRGGDCPFHTGIGFSQRQNGGVTRDTMVPRYLCQGGTTTAKLLFDPFPTLGRVGLNIFG